MTTAPLCPHGHSARYSVNVYDCAGEFGSWSAGDFAEAFAVYQQFVGRYPGKVIQVFNVDRCDYNTNGLTEDERDAIETEDAARAALKQAGAL